VSVRPIPALTLNVVPASFSSATLEIGRVAYTNEDDYARFRGEHWQTHAFRFDTRSREARVDGSNTRPAWWPREPRSTSVYCADGSTGTGIAKVSQLRFTAHTNSVPTKTAQSLDRAPGEMIPWRGSERDGMDQPGGSFSFGASAYPK
jgi:hypothetical protein